MMKKQIALILAVFAVSNLQAAAKRFNLVRYEVVCVANTDLVKGGNLVNLDRDFAQEQKVWKESADDVLAGELRPNQQLHKTNIEYVQGGNDAKGMTCRVYSVVQER